MAEVYVGRDTRVRWEEHPDNVGVDQYWVLFKCAAKTVTKVVKASDYQREDENGLREYAAVLSYEENAASGLTREPEITIKVRSADGLFADEDEWLVISTENPPPPAPTLSQITSRDGVSVSISKGNSAITDLTGWRIVVSTAANADYENITPLHECWQGDSFTLSIADDLPRYVWVAGVDAFGPALADYAAVTVQRDTLDDIIDPLQDQLVGIAEDLAIDAAAFAAGHVLDLGARMTGLESTLQQTVYQDGQPIVQIGQNVITRLNDVEASNLQTTTLVAGLQGNIAAATEQVETLATTVGASTTSLQTFIAGADGRISAVESGVSVNATAIQTEATTRQSQLSTLGDNFAGQIGTLTTSVNTERSRIDAANTIIANHGGNLVTLTAATTANATAISSEITNRTAAVTQVGNNLTAYTTSNNQEVSTVKSRITQTELRLTQHDGSFTAVQTSLDTLTTNLAAEVTARTTLAGTVGANKTLFDQQVTLRTTQFNAQALINSDLTARVGTAEGKITTLQNVTSNGTFASASSVTTLTARLNSGGDVFASITNAASVAADAQGRANATFGLTSNVNGLISGIQSYNNGAISRLDFMASRIRFMNDAGTQAVVPLSVANGKVYLTDTVINGNLLVSGTVNNVHITDNAIIGLSAAYQGALTNLTGNTAFRAQGVWINVSKATSPVKVSFSALVNWVHNAGGSFTGFLQIWRSRSLAVGTGTVIYGVTLYGSGMANDTFQGFLSPSTLDYPGETGDWHYYATLATNTANMSTQTVSARYMEAQEFKNNTGGSLGTGTGGAGGGGTPPPDTGGGGGTDPYDPGGGGSCPVPETPITMADQSTKPAGEIAVGDRVWTQHETTMAWGAYEVSHVSRSTEKTWFLPLNNGASVQASTGHRLRRANGEWIEIQNVAAGTALASGNVPLVTTNDAIENGYREVIKITVADAHTYLTAGVVSHNVKPIYVEP